MRQYQLYVLMIVIFANVGCRSFLNSARSGDSDVAQITVIGKDRELFSRKVLYGQALSDMLPHDKLDRDKNCFQVYKHNKTSENPEEFYTLDYYQRQCVNSNGQLYNEEPHNPSFSFPLALAEDGKSFKIYADYVESGIVIGTLKHVEVTNINYNSTVYRRDRYYELESLCPDKNVCAIKLAFGEIAKIEFLKRTQMCGYIYYLYQEEVPKASYLSGYYMQSAIDKKNPSWVVKFEPRAQVYQTLEKIRKESDKQDVRTYINTCLVYSTIDPWDAEKMPKKIDNTKGIAKVHKIVKSPEVIKRNR